MTDQTGPKRNKAQREYDLKEISDLYLRGWYQSSIAIHLGKNRDYVVSQQTISKDIKTLQKRWLASSLVSFDDAKASELAKIDALEREAWSAYILSKEPIVKRKTSKKIDGATTEATQEISLGPGDPRYFETVKWCIEKRVKIHGLDAPTRKEISGPAGGPIETRDITPDFSQLTDDELRAYISISKKFDNKPPNNTGS